MHKNILPENVTEIWPPIDNLDALMGGFPEPIIVTNIDHQVVFVNRAAERLFGGGMQPGEQCPFCSETAVIAGTGAETPHCPEAGESLRQVPVMLKTRWPVGAPLSLSATPICDADNRKTGCFILIREHAELLIHPVMEQQMATLSSILENFPMPFFLVDPFLVVTHLNDHMERLTGYTRSEVVGRMTCGTLLNTAQCDTCD